MKEKKVNYKKVLLSSCILSIFFSSIIGFFNYYSIYNSHSSCYVTTDPSAQNGQFESYFGTHVSAIEVKQLLSLVRSNNISDSQDNDEEIKKVYINSKDSTLSGTEENTIGVEVKTRNYYTVDVMNEKVSAPEVSISENNAGYYNNGYIRNIRITQNPKSSTSYSNNINNSYFNNEVLSTNEVNSNSKVQ